MKTSKVNRHKFSLILLSNDAEKSLYSLYSLINKSKWQVKRKNIEEVKKNEKLVFNEKETMRAKALNLKQTGLENLHFMISKFLL